MMTMTLQDEIKMEQQAGQDTFKTDQKGKVTIKTAALRAAVQKIAQMVNPKNSRPILTGIYFNVATDVITLRGANDSFYEEILIDKEEFMLDGHNSGLVFPAKKFSEVVGKLTGVNTTIEFDGLQATIRSKGAKVNLSGQHVEQFPDFPVIKQATTFELPAGALLHMYQHTIYATSKDEKIPILGGVCHDIKDSRFRCIATDRHRLSQVYYEQDVEVDEVRKVIPTSTVTEIMKHLKSSTTVKVSVDDAHIIYQMEGVTVFSRVLDGPYPNTDAIVPPGFKSTVTFNSDELLAAFRRAGIFTDEQGASKLTLIVDPSSKQLRLLSVKSEYGQSQEDITSLSGEGEFVSLTCNVRYLVDIFSRLPKEGTIELKLNGVTPFVIQQRNAEKGNVFVVVPVKDQNDKISTISDFNPATVEADPFAERAEQYATEANAADEDAA